MGNSGMIAGAFSSVSGKADKTLDSNGQILYYNSGRQALNIGEEGEVLTVLVLICQHGKQLVLVLICTI